MTDMKRNILLIFFALLVFSCTAQTKLKKGVEIGNSSGVVLIDSVTTDGNNIYFWMGEIRLTESDVMKDSIDALIERATQLPDIVWQKTDTAYTHKQVITYDQLMNYAGAGGGFSYYSKEFTVGDSGFPEAGDSTITSTNWAGRDIKVFRDGSLQRRRIAADGKYGARINNSTGQVTVHPAFISEEEIIIEATDPTARYEAIISGTESSLRTGFIAGWQLDETAGNTANEITGYFPGTNTNVTVNAIGKFGKAFQYAGTGYTNMGTTAPLRVQTYTISFWVNTTQTSFAGLLTNWVWAVSRYYGFDIAMASDGTLENHLTFSDNTALLLTSTDKVNDGEWHNIIATWDGTHAYLYIDNVQQDTDGSSAKTIQYHANCAFHLGDRNEGDQPFIGYLDAVYILNRVVTSGERATLQTKNYPFE